MSSAIYKTFMSEVDLHNSADDQMIIDSNIIRVSKRRNRERLQYDSTYFDDQYIAWKEKLEDQQFFEPYSQKNVTVVKVERMYELEKRKRKLSDTAIAVWVVRDDCEDLILDPELLDDMKMDYEILEYYCVRFNVNEFDLEQKSMIR